VRSPEGPGVSRPGPLLLLALILLASLSSFSGCGVSPGTGGGDGTQPSGESGGEIRWAEGAAGSRVVEVRGLSPATLERLRAAPPTPEGWYRIFPVFTGTAEPTDGRPPVLGTYSLEPDGPRFTPRLPFVPGQPYFARWSDPAEASAPGDPGASPSAPSLTATLTLPAPDVEPSTVVAAIHPDTAEIPENLLKIYLRFSAPMTRGDTFRHVHLLGASGEEVEAPFVAPQAELWSPDSTRLTLFFDPGRLKRGVLPHDTVGPPLVAGHTYTLVVDRDLEDARGALLAETFRHTFRVTAADRSQPRVEDWRLTPPGGGRDPVELRFPEPLDRALLEHMLHVESAGGESVPGAVEVLPKARGWRFRPSEPWVGGAYAVVVDTALEDLAGNSLRRLFDVETLEREPPATERGVVRLPFTVSVLSAVHWSRPRRPRATGPCKPSGAPGRPAPVGALPGT